MEKMTCETCKHEYVSPFYEPCHTCIDRAADSGSLATLWEPYSDCDTCQHHNTPDLMQCNACTSVAALTGERWTLHVPAMPPKPSARTIPITSAPIAQPAPVSQASGASTSILKAPSADPLPVTDEETAEPLSQAAEAYVARVYRDHFGEALPDPRPIWPHLIAVAALAFCAGISYGFLIANLRVHQ